MCAQLHIFSLWRLTWVFDGTWKNFHKNVCPVTHFFRSADYLKFLMWLGKFRQKSVTSYMFFPLWRLTWVFDETWKNFHKKVCPVTRFFAVESILSFWWDLEKFRQKGVPSYTFFFAVQTILSFGWDLEKFWQKGVTSYTFFRSACYLKFWIGLRKVSTKMCAQLHIFSLWRLTWVFDGTWKNFHKNVCPVTHFFRSADYLKFLMWLGKFRQKSVTSYMFFSAVETNLSFWWGLGKIFTKSVPSHTFLRCGEYLKFLMGLGKFRQKSVTSYTFFFAVETILSFWWDLRKIFTKRCAQLHLFSLWRLS